MYHSIWFGTDASRSASGKNSWAAWHLVPTSRPLVNPPPVKTNYIPIPGADALLDLTESLSGRPLYGNRSGSWEFLVMNDYHEWQELYSEIMAYLHGKILQVVLEDDTTYFYEGRLSVNSWKSNPTNSVITIDYNLQPYKKTIEAVSRSYNVSGSLDAVIGTGSPMPVTPTFTASAAGMAVKYKNVTYTLAKGSNTLRAIQIPPNGSAAFQFTGTGSVTIQYRGGRL